MFENNLIMYCYDIGVYLRGCCIYCMSTDKKDEQSENIVPDNDWEHAETKIARGSLPKKGFLENLAKKADEIRRQGIELSKIAAREAEELGEKIDDVVDDSWDAAKKLRPKSVDSKNEIINLLERLAKLKEQGIITEKEFNSKKKDLLDKI